MLKVKDIKLSFGNNEVLKGINFKIEKGQVISIIGPSGSGKSTFLRSLNFLETPDEGEITFDGKVFNIKNMSKKDINELREENRELRMKLDELTRSFEKFKEAKKNENT